MILCERINAVSVENFTRRIHYSQTPRSNLAVSSLQIFKESHIFLRNTEVNGLKFHSCRKKFQYLFHIYTHYVIS